jgi:hypothetical protein
MYYLSNYLMIPKKIHVQNAKKIEFYNWILPLHFLDHRSHKMAARVENCSIKLTRSGYIWKNLQQSDVSLSERVQSGWFTVPIICFVTWHVRCHVGSLLSRRTIGVLKRYGTRRAVQDRISNFKRFCEDSLNPY